MSDKIYQKLLTEANCLLAQPIVVETVQAAAKPTKKRKDLIKRMGLLRIKYLSLIEKLSWCLDQLYHPQKRIIVRKLLDLCTGRCIELRREYTDYIFSDYFYNDDLLIENFKTPFDIELKPCCPAAKSARYEAIAYRKAIFKQLIETMEFERKMTEEADALRELRAARISRGQDPNEPTPSPSRGMSQFDDLNEKDVIVHPIKIYINQNTIPLDRQVAFDEIQRHERARMARIIFQDLVTKRRRAKFYEENPHIKKKVTEKDRMATKRIQAWYRIILAKRRVSYRDYQMSVILEMAQKAHRPPIHWDKMLRNCEDRRPGIKERQTLMEKAYVDELERIHDVGYLEMQERFSDEVRDWFWKWYFKTGRFPDFPTEDEGGSWKLHYGEVMTIAEYDSIKSEIEKFNKMSKAEKNKYKQQKQKAKDKKKAEEIKDKEKAEEKKRKKKEEEKNLDPDDRKYHFKPTVIFPQLEEAQKEYEDIWMTRDEKNNPFQYHVQEFIAEDMRKEVEIEVRKVVDDMMRGELVQLHAAMVKDKKKAYTKQIENPPKKKKAKTKKKKKDPTADRTYDDLFEELFRNDIIENYEPVNLSDYLGELSFKNFDIRNDDLNPVPALGDVRQLILELAILPMTSPVVHEMVSVNRAICLAGPNRSGKHMLANAVCTELSAVKYNLSCENLVGKYVGKRGMKTLLHLITKMAIYTQPSVIFIGNIEIMFYKKKDLKQLKEAGIDPKRLKKKIKTIIKGFKPGDQVLLLVTNDMPWLCPARKFNKTYKIIIMIPRTDYGTVKWLWEYLLTKYVYISREFDFSSLSLLTMGMPVPMIMQVVYELLNLQRRMLLPVKPLTPKEILEYMIDFQPITNEEFDMFQKWIDKTKMGKKMKKYVAAKKQERDRRLYMAEREAKKKKMK